MTCRSTLPATFSSSRFSVFCTQSLDGCTQWGNAIIKPMLEWQLQCKLCNGQRLPCHAADTYAAIRCQTSAYAVSMSCWVWQPDQDLRPSAATQAAQLQQLRHIGYCWATEIASELRKRHSQCEDVDPYLWLMHGMAGASPAPEARTAAAPARRPGARWRQCCPRCLPGRRGRRLRCAADCRCGRP